MLSGSEAMARDRETELPSVLLVGLDEAAAASVRDALVPTGVAVHCAPDGKTALDMAPHRRFAGLIAAYPLPDLPMSVFLDAVRRRGSAWQSTALLLLTGLALRGDAEVYVGRGANRVVTVEEAGLVLADLLERLLATAPRVAIRVPGRIEVRADTYVRRVLCQTWNVSATGMLLRGPHTYPPATELGFELFMPGDLEPVRGKARVVRQTLPPREPMPGIGVAFASFAAGDEARFQSHLRRLMA
jgi:CheY-like chemotaxis protein